METSIHSLGPRRPPAADSFDCRAEKIDAWVAALPMLNVGETVRMLYRALREINELEIPLPRRLHAMEAFREPLHFVLDAMRRHYTGRGLPLRARERQVSELCVAMCRQMALGYRIVAEEDDTGRRAWLKDARKSASARHRALYYLGRALLICYEAYQPYPKQLRQTLHAVYADAERHKLQQIEIRDKLTEPATKSVEEEYKRLLLLALACPYRLRPQDTDSIYRMLVEWVAAAELQPPPWERPPANSVFTVDLESDQPPSYHSLAQATNAGGSMRLLDAARLSDRVRSKMASAATEDRGDRKDSGESDHRRNNALRRLLMAWGALPKRRFNRHESHTSALVAVGLRAIHAYTSGEAAWSGIADLDEAPEYDGRAHFRTSQSASERSLQPDVWDVNRLADAEPCTVELGKRAGMHLQKTHEYRLLDSSAGGYRLLWELNTTCEAQVGELVGIRDVSEVDAFHLSLGIIRWMKETHDQKLELGVQMLAPGAVAIGVKGLGPGVRKRPYTRSLLLPELRSLRQPATLLLPALAFRSGSTILVASHGQEMPVQLTRLVENTGIVAQFQFIAQPTEQQATASKEPTPESDFDSLWDEL